MSNKELIKNLKAEGIKFSNKELVALSPGNDPYNITPGIMKDVKWITNIWKKEGSPTIHARGLHYRILGKYKVCIEMKKEGDTKRKPYNITYENTNQCWNKLGCAIKNAQYLGYIPYKNILDMKNTFVEELGDFYDDEISCDYYASSNIDLEDEDKFLETLKQQVLDSFSLEIYGQQHQQFYMELWAEKSGVIPKDIARKYGITIRECGGGESSLDMAYKAVLKAKEYGKALFVFHLTDYDPKGDLSMIKGAARKIEYVARDYDIKAYYEKICLTYEQCEKYKLPEIPAKNPDNPEQGGKGYVTLINRHKNRGRRTTEINAFQALYPEKYRGEIEDAIKPYFDDYIDDRIEGWKKDYMNEVRDAANEWIGENKEEILEKARDLWNARKEVEKSLEDVNNRIIKKDDELTELRNERDETKSEKEEELKVEEKEGNYTDSVDIDTEEIMDDVDIYEIEPYFEYPEDALLDTNREYLEQIKHYREWDGKFEENGEGGEGER